MIKKKKLKKGKRLFEIDEGGSELYLYLIEKEEEEEEEESQEL